MAKHAEAVLPDAFLRSCLLVLLAEDAAHGYELQRRLAVFGLAPDPGTVYRQLRAMEDEGLASSRWEESPDGPPRRVYSVTGQARQHLHDFGRSIEGTVEVLRELRLRCEQVAAAHDDGGGRDRAARG